MIIFLGISHGLISLSLYLLIVRNTRIEFNLIAAAIIVFYSLVPDLDASGSKIGRKTMGISILIEALVGHRGAFHSLLVGLILSSPLLLLGKSYFYWSVFGFYSHLALDGLTKTSFPIFFPYQKKYSLKLIRTGSGEEALLTLLAIAYILL